MCVSKKAIGCVKGRIAFFYSEIRKIVLPAQNNYGEGGYE